jgi:hypothetical protein
LPLRKEEEEMDERVVQEATYKPIYARGFLEGIKNKVNQEIRPI